MNKPTMIKAMKASISKVLEQMFFLPIDVVMAEGGATSVCPDHQQAIAASVGFSGPFSGTFILSIPADLAASVTADFLGTMPGELTGEQINGTVKEMINMLAGNSLSTYDPESPFNLQIPELTSLGIGNHHNIKSAESIDIVIETTDSLLTLQMAA